MLRGIPNKNPMSDPAAKNAAAYKKPNPKIRAVANQENGETELSAKRQIASRPNAVKQRRAFLVITISRSSAFPLDCLSFHHPHLPPQNLRRNEPAVQKMKKRRPVAPRRPHPFKPAVPAASNGNIGSLNHRHARI